MVEKPTYLLGIDLGTTYLKATVLDKAGRVIAEARRRHKTYSPGPSRHEQEPSEWWNNLLDMMPEVLAHIKKGFIESVSFSGQMHGLVMVDEAGDPLIPSIIWEDKRSGKVATAIEEKIGWSKIKSILGNKPMPGFTLPKLIWVKQNLPKVYRSAYKILLPKGYLRYRLTGRFSMEVTDASSGLLVNIRERSWAKDLIEGLDIDTGLLPELEESTDRSGKITEESAKLTGLRQGTPVIAGAGDQQAGAVGAGIVSEGTFSATIGTGGQVYTVTDSLKIEPEGRVHTFCHCFPGKWQVMGAMKTAGRSLEWLKDDVLSMISSTDSSLTYNDLDELAGKAEPGSGGLIFLPYLSGERTPHLDPRARGLFFGLTLEHGLPEIVRSLMEGVSYNMRYALELLLQLDIDFEELRLEGGGVNSSIWPRLQADIFGRELLVTKRKYDKSAYGAAILAGLGTGIISEIDSGNACGYKATREDKIKPEASNGNIYNEHYKRFKKLYPAVKDLF